MLGMTLLNFSPLVEGRLIRRYKRFLVEVELTDGEIITAHCANTGPMKGVLHQGGRVRLRYNPSPTRKLDWTWEQAEVVGSNGRHVWVGINTSLPNKLIKLAIENGCLNKELGVIAKIRTEVTYGIDRRSRIDLYLLPNKDVSDGRVIYLEVKNTTWSKGTLALFPDTVTKRGQKHLKELIGVLPDARSVLVPCISRPDLEAFAPGDEADPVYGDLFRKALIKGVEVIPCCFEFHKDHITWAGLRPVIITHHVS